MLFGKKPIEVMKNCEFVAAYSEHPFAEEKNEARYPDYSFHKVDGMHWCVRIGEIKIPWGFGLNTAPFIANGEITVSRKNVSASSLDGHGFDYERVGDIFYLSEEKYISKIKPTILDLLRSFAKESSAQTFKTDLLSISEYPRMKRFLEESRLTLSSVIVNHTK